MGIRLRRYLLLTLTYSMTIRISTRSLAKTLPLIQDILDEMSVNPDTFLENFRTIRDTFNFAQGLDLLRPCHPDMPWAIVAQSLIACSPTKDRLSVDQLNRLKRLYPTKLVFDHIFVDKKKGSDGSGKGGGEGGGKGGGSARGNGKSADGDTNEKPIGGIVSQCVNVHSNRFFEVKSPPVYIIFFLVIFSSVISLIRFRNKVEFNNPNSPIVNSGICLRTTESDTAKIIPRTEIYSTSEFLQETDELYYEI